jgi:hypothetical protein
MIHAPVAVSKTFGAQFVTDFTSQRSGRLLSPPSGAHLPRFSPQNRASEPV